MRQTILLFVFVALLIPAFDAAARGIPPTVFETQSYLSAYGYYTDAIDGQCGPNTLGALGKFLNETPQIGVAAPTCPLRDLSKLNQALREKLKAEREARTKTHEVDENSLSAKDVEAHLGQIDLDIRTLKHSTPITPSSDSRELSLIAINSLLAGFCIFSMLLCAVLLHSRSNPSPVAVASARNQGAGLKTVAPNQVEDPAYWRATALLRFGDRGRTIDQVKRLYAVVMGFAVTNSFANAYKTYPYYQNQKTILAAQIISLLTLIVVIYLGTERLLDRRYLDITKQGPPRRLTVLFDLITQGATAAWFVVLSDTFPTRKTDIIAFQHFFVNNLIILYLLNAVVLSINVMMIVTDRIKEKKGPFSPTVDYHLAWIFTNVTFYIALQPATAPRSYLHQLLPSVPSYAGYAAKFFADKPSEVSALAMTLIAMHTIRFLADFLICYAIYYPQLELPEVKNSNLFNFQE